MSKMHEMMKNNAQSGIIEWIGVRPAKKVEMMQLQKAHIKLNGLDQDYRVNPGKRSVTLVQWEHLPVIASIMGCKHVGPELLRRNIAVSGINLLGLRKHTIKIGDAVLKISGLCAPCSFMEKTLGHGGFNAVRGHGGVTAEVVKEGIIEIGSAVQLLEFND
ncbi:MOSC domain-containing protein [Kordiimonas aquimaris]|uniref:MOSC domain-containing protein n=1 Tax=Kordiimonas aquimaris TaxID=707591 RepID=UPI0021D0B7CE|nr:MOSC domain-containing protein [Kordiimonas aquimaris]